MNGLERGLARLRDFRWDMYAQPMREMRLEMQIVYFAIHMPFGRGVTFNIPVLTMIKPISSSAVEPEPAPPVQESVQESAEEKA